MRKPTLDALATERGRQLRTRPAITLRTLVVCASLFSSIAHAQVDTARLTTSGALDTTYSGDGIFPIDWVNCSESATDVATTGTRAFIVGLKCDNESFILRTTSSGSVDGGFGIRYLSNFEIYAVAVDSSGRPVVVGNIDSEMAVARFTTGGSLDTTFSSDGVVTVPFSATTRAYDVVIQSDGKIVAAGSAGWPGVETMMIAARFNTNGSVDTGFASGGAAFVAFPNSSAAIAEGVAIGPNGRIVLAGQIYVDSGSSYVLQMGSARLNAGGTLDTSYSSDGLSVIDFVGMFWEWATAVKVDSSNRVVVAGRAYDSNGNFQVALARWTSSGSLDTSFSSDGKQLTNIGNSTWDWANDLALQGDGKILVASQAGDSTGTSIAVLRYNTNGSLDTTYAGTGIRLITTPSSSTANGIGIDSNGRAVVAGN